MIKSHNSMVLQQTVQPQACNVISIMLYEICAARNNAKRRTGIPMRACRDALRPLGERDRRAAGRYGILWSCSKAICRLGRRAAFALEMLYARAESSRRLDPWYINLERIGPHGAAECWVLRVWERGSARAGGFVEIGVSKG